MPTTGSRQGMMAGSEIGRPRRVIQLPFRVDADKVQARFNNGVLEIELERLEADRPKKIEIRAA